MNALVNARPRLGPAAFSGVVTAIAGAMLAVVLWAEVSSEPVTVNWTIFVLISLLLLACERTPRAWVRSGQAGVVTPLWMFSYALILIGSHSIAIGVALLGIVVHGRSRTDAHADAITRAAGTTLSLATAALMLKAFGVDGTITNLEAVPVGWATAIVMTGLAIVLLNAVIAAIALSTKRSVSFLTIMQRDFGSRVTAEGALLSLAPLWVIGLDFSPVLIPLLGITTILVFRSTRQALERLEEAQHDALTGLPNRRSFIDAVDDSLAKLSAANPHVLLLDLNGFKEINDRLGHDVGDAVLIAFSERLRRALPAAGTGARLGGDEFAVIIVTPVGQRFRREIIEELHAALTQPLDIHGFPVTIGVSIGAAAAPADGHTTRDLLRAADVAMYRAKRTGTPVEWYANGIQVKQRGRLNLLTDLGNALEANQLHIHFQPQLRLTDGQIDTVEALIRWNHPDHGEISPSEFIGLAEQTDLIAPITEMVLRAASKGLLTTGEADVRLAVNVSSRSLQDPYFADDVFSVLDENGFPPSRLELEVTERALVANVERSRYTIDLLRKRGVRIAIDDFGVGYSSYQTLRLLDVDRVKVDRDFVQGLLVSPRDRLIVSSLIELAHDLGLDVVAEGVEGPAIWNELTRLRCDVAQGYAIAPPMSYLDLRRWLPQWDASMIHGIADHVT
ncbi:MAG: EAL domain-containing protein [Ilumatobacter sp.]|uniref:putative bifunctional diguanylate cyclase/phosphodiesterase n=1 Tax=Ilumatobacter sp. TaxID=1967498 RepID=UPI002637229E|nr:GGDEF domain-containing phosphodiesterase [Ilumatobacter sp.]MDJ0770998.1 EAL domain-containing protein [Ilumatobacter sp.]